jgi:hypothetical protein
MGCAATHYAGTAGTLWRSLAVGHATIHRLTLRSATTLAAVQPKPPFSKNLR